MSILQEYEDIRRQLGEEEWDNIDTFLSENKQYQLSDVLYKEKVWKIYEDWKRGSFDMKVNRKKNIKFNRKVGHRPVTAARITTDFSNFKPWSGAVDTWNELEKYDKIDLLEQILDDTYYNEEAGEAVMSETELNDLLWFEPESVYEWVGLYYNDETGEVSDEPFDSDDEDDEYDEDEDIEESRKLRGRKAIKSNRRINKRRPIKAAESYGWELDSSEAWEAYEFACDYFGKENLDDQIVSGLSTDELAEALVYIFRMNDFREWDERNGNSDSDSDDEKYELPDAGVRLTRDELIDYVNSNLADMTYDDLSEAYEHLYDDWRIYNRDEYLKSTDTFKALDAAIDTISSEMDRREEEEE